MQEYLRHFEPVWNYTLLGNRAGQYVTSLLIFVAVLVAAKVFNRIILRTSHRWAESTATHIDDMIVRHFLRPLYYIFILLGIYLGLETLSVPEMVHTWIRRFLLAGGILVGFVFLFRFLEDMIRRAGASYVERMQTEEDADRDEQERVVNRIVKQAREVLLTVFIIVGLLTLLANLGVDLKAIWASLGIGGIAVVVAVKDPLTNIVGRIYIFSTGIFDEGHFIVFKNWAGTVKRVGFFRTNLEMFSDMTTVSIPNAQFINEGVKNYYGRTKFMYKWDLDVPYDTTPERIEQLLSALKELIAGLPELNPDRCWIYLDRLDRYSKVVRVWFQVNLPDWATSLHYGSGVLRTIQEVFASQGVDFAFPTSTIQLEGATDAGQISALLPEQVEGSGSESPQKRSEPS